MGKKNNSFRLLERKLEGKRLLEKPRCRLVDNIKFDLRGIKCGGLERIDLASDRNEWRALVNTVNCREVLEWLHNWRLLMKGSAPRS
jgi:hypothetical protein